MAGYASDMPVVAALCVGAGRLSGPRHGQRGGKKQVLYHLVLVAVGVGRARGFELIRAVFSRFVMSLLGPLECPCCPWICFCLSEDILLSDFDT